MLSTSTSIGTLARDGRARPAPTTTATCAPRCSRAPSATLARARRRASCRCASSRARSASATPRRAATSPTSRRCSTRSPRTASSASGASCAARCARRRPAFDARLPAFAHAYVRFATRHAALLELMFAGKHRPGADRQPARGGRPRLRGAARADRRGPGGRRRRRRATPSASRSSPGPRCRASRRWPTAACSTAPRSTSS